MSEDIAHPVFLDATVLSNFASSGTVARLVTIPVTGSVGVLISGIRREAIDIDPANEWLTEWREKRGYYAPVERVEDILE